MDLSGALAAALLSLLAREASPGRVASVRGRDGGRVEAGGSTAFREGWGLGVVG